MKWNLKSRKSHNLILFTLNFIYIFFLGILEEFIDTHFVYYTVISAIIFVSIFTVKESEDSKTLVYPLLVVVATWVAELMNLPLAAHITGVISTIFFFIIIALLIRRISRSKSVGTLELLESVNIYLLLGIAASLLFHAVYTYNHDAYHPPGEILNFQGDFIYYSFVTMTTLGYGDIYPINPIPRSLSIFFSVTGQLYLALIIAMLVGKYIGQEQSQEGKN